jgi:hypothetical protein
VKVWNVSTGPNTSRWTISLSFDAGSTSVGSYHSPSAADDPVAGRASAVDEARHAREVIGVDHRRDRGGRVERVPEHVVVDVAVEPLQELVTHRRLDEQAGAGEAHLTTVVVLPGCLRGGGLEVGVGEHDERPLPAELGRERHEVRRSGATDVASGLG